MLAQLPPHPNVIALYGVCLWPHTNTVYLVMVRCALRAVCACMWSLTDQLHHYPRHTGIRPCHAGGVRAEGKRAFLAYSPAMHLHIPRTHQLSHTQTHKQGDYAPGGNKGFLAYGQALLDTMAFLHAADIVHRDLKPSNLLLVRPFGGLEFGVWG